MNGAVTAKRWGFRSVVVVRSLQPARLRPQDHRCIFWEWERTPYPLFSHTEPTLFFMPLCCSWAVRDWYGLNGTSKSIYARAGKKEKKKKCRLSVPPFLDRNLHAILSTFAGNDHSEWVMTLMTTLYYTQLVYMSPEGRNKLVYLNSLFLCWAVLTNIPFQVLHRLEKRPGQLLWHRSSGGDHFHQRAPGQGEHRPT